MNSEKAETAGYLIEAVKSFPELYDTTHEDYKNKNKKNKLWREIATTLGEPNVNIVKSKWKNLKDCYYKYLRTRMSAGGPVCKYLYRYRTWPWAASMAFMDPFIGIIKNYGPLDPENSDIQEYMLQNSSDREYTNSEDTEFQTDKTPNVKDNSVHRNRKRMKSRDQDIQLESVVDYMNSSNSGEHDGTDLIFLGYSRIVKKFSPYRQAKVKYQIAKIVMEAEIENMKEMGQSAMACTAAGRNSSPTVFDPPEVRIETLHGVKLENTSSQSSINF